MTDESLFAAALDTTDPADRARLLESVCGPDADRRKRIESLLAAYAGAGSFLGRPAVEPTRPQPVDPGATTHATVVRPSADFDDVTAVLGPARRPDALGRLAHYDILEILGRGGFGVVFRAFDTALERVVAVKVLAPAMAATSPARKRFVREAKSTASVRHENVVQVHAVEDHPLPYLVMEYIPGETLQQRLDRTGPLDIGEVVRIGRQVAEGLAAAHAVGLIHRDVKPANVLIERGPQDRAKLTDFGLARAADDASISQSGIVAGTPLYMSPEQARGDKIDHRADLFSLGSVLYAIASGRPPFRAESTLAVLKRVCEDTPRPIRDILPDVPDWYCRIVGKLHAKDPADRFQTAKEVADLLADCEKQLAESGAIRDFSRIPGGEPERGGLPWEAIGLFLLFVLVNAGLVLWGSELTGLSPRIVQGMIAVGCLVVMIGGWLGSWVAGPKWADRFQTAAGFACLLSAGNGALFLYERNVADPPAVRSLRDKVAERQREMEAAVARFDADKSNPAPGLAAKSALTEARVELAEAQGDTAAVVAYLTELVKDRQSEQQYARLRVEVGFDPPEGVTRFDELVASAAARLVKAGGSPPPPTTPDPAVIRPLRDAVAAKEKSARTAAERVEAGIDNPAKQVAADIELADARVRLAEAEGDKAAVVAHLTRLVAHRKEDRRLAGLRVEAEVEIAAGLSAYDARLAEAEARLAKAGGKPTAAEFTPLFNGKDLTGWTPDAKHPGKWVVENGVLTGIEPGYLFTARNDYKNFRLRVEARVSDGGRSSLVFRCPNEVLRVGPELAFFGVPRSYFAYLHYSQVNDMRDRRTGSVAMSNPAGDKFPKALFAVTDDTLTKPDEWFTLELTADGNKFRTTIDGKEAATCSDPASTYTAGHIAVGVFCAPTRLQFRKIEIQELPRPDDGFTPLFNGKDMTGWLRSPVPPGKLGLGDWQVRDGVLEARSTFRDYLFTEQGDYRNFHLRVEAKMNAGGDGGLLFRCEHGLSSKFNTARGYETELGDLPEVPHGSLRLGPEGPDNTVTAKPVRSRAGQWFTQEVIVREGHVVVKIDDEEVLNYHAKPEHYTRGHIALQVWGEQTELSFRKVEIKELPAEPAGSAAARTPPREMRPIGMINWGTLVDPTGTCRVQTTVHDAHVTVPGGRRLFLSPMKGFNRDGPRWLWDAAGDFTYQVSVRNFPAAKPDDGTRIEADNFLAAGFVVWVDARNFVRFERAWWDTGKVSRSYWHVEGFVNGESSDQLRLPAEGATAHFRIERQGAKLLLRRSADGLTWDDWHTITRLPMGDKVRVGLAAVNGTTDAFHPVFENLATGVYPKLSREVAPVPRGGR